MQLPSTSEQSDCRVWTHVLVACAGDASARLFGSEAVLPDARTTLQGLAATFMLHCIYESTSVAPTSGMLSRQVCCHVRYVVTSGMLSRQVCCHVRYVVTSGMLSQTRATGTSVPGIRTGTDVESANVEKLY